MKTRLPLDPTGKPRVFEVGTEAFVLYIFSFHFFLFSLSFFFFLFFFLTLLGLTCSLWKFSRSEMNQSCSSGLYYSHSNARSEPSV